jgi:hypothetical protein
MTAVSLLLSSSENVAEEPNVFSLDHDHGQSVFVLCSQWGLLGAYFYLFWAFWVGFEEKKRCNVFCDAVKDSM